MLAHMTRGVIPKHALILQWLMIDQPRNNPETFQFPVKLYSNPVASIPELSFSSPQQTRHHLSSCQLQEFFVTYPEPVELFSS